MGVSPDAQVNGDIICHPKTTVKSWIFTEKWIIQIVYMKDFLRFNFWRFVSFTGILKTLFGKSRKSQRRFSWKFRRNSHYFWLSRQKIFKFKENLDLHNVENNILLQGVIHIFHGVFHTGKTVVLQWIYKLYPFFWIPVNEVFTFSKVCFYFT